LWSHYQHLKVEYAYAVRRLGTFKTNNWSPRLLVQHWADIFDCNRNDASKRLKDIKKDGEAKNYDDQLGWRVLEKALSKDEWDAANDTSRTRFKNHLNRRSMRSSKPN
jgi:hypothetical protein